MDPPSDPKDTVPVPTATTTIPATQLRMVANYSSELGMAFIWPIVYACDEVYLDELVYHLHPSHMVQ